MCVERAIASDSVSWCTTSMSAKHGIYRSASQADPNRPAVLAAFMILRIQKVRIVSPCLASWNATSWVVRGLSFSPKPLYAAHWMISQQNSTKLIDGNSHIFKVEEDGVEAKEHKTNSRCEPAKGAVPKSIGVDPHFHMHPSFWLSELVVRIFDV